MNLLGSVRRRYLALLAGSFAIVLSCGYWLMDRERDKHLELVAEQLAQSARMISITQKGLLVAGEKLLRDIALDEEALADGRPADSCPRTLRRYLSGNPAFYNIGMLDERGRVVCMGVAAALPEIDFSHLPFVDRARAADGLVVSDVQVSPVTGRPALYFAMRDHVKSAAQHIVFFAALDLDWLNSQLAQFVTLQAGELALVDGRGKQLAKFRAGAGQSPLPTQVVRTDVELFGRLLGADQVGTAISTQPDGRDKLVGFALFARTTSGPAYLLVSVDKMETLAPALRAVYLQMGLIVSGLLVVWAFIFVGGGRLFLARIDNIFHVTRRIAAGDLSARVAFAGHRDELDALGHAFDDMAKRLEEQQSALVRLNVTLERTNRSLMVLSSGNRALLECRSRIELLDQVCRKIVRVGSYPLAVVVRFGPSTDLMFGVEAACPEEYAGESVRKAFESVRNLAMEPLIAGLRQSVAQSVACRGESALDKFSSLCELGELNQLVFLPLSDNHHVNGSLIIGTDQADGFLPDELKYLEETARDVSFGLRSLMVAAEHHELKGISRDFQLTLRASLEETLAAIAAALEMRDPYTAGHERRVAALAVAIAARLGLSEEDAHAVYLAGIVHDIGKMKVPAEILVKPSRLSMLEFELIKEHAAAGYEILRTIKFPWPIAEMVHQHHERIDGSGYPQGLIGGSILFGPRILAVADVVESMVSHRPYRAALGVTAAIEEIKAGVGSRYDMQVVKACIEIFDEGDFQWSS